MKTSVKKGFSFGLASGIITTLGLIVGLNSSTHSKTIIITTIILIAIADSFSDAFGIHISEESQKKVSHKKAWESTLSTFIFKLIFAFTFVIPLALLSLSIAIIASIFWGLFLISFFSYHIAKQQNKKPFKVISEHLFISIFVIIITHLVGTLISTF